MFTGIVSAIGTIDRIVAAGGRRFDITTGWPGGTVQPGASVAHAGVCLTATEVWDGGHSVDVSPETLARTTLDRLAAGSRVNLERSLTVGEELGGHLVFGHVDGQGRLDAVFEEADSHRLRFSAPADLLPLIAVKGSIAVDGVSLTVNALQPDGFEVTIIPHTWRETTLGRLTPGDAVNLEADMLARYVARQLQTAGTPGAHPGDRA